MLAIILAIASATPRDDLIGRYSVVDTHGRIACRLRLFYQPGVGGEIDAPPACAAILPISDGLRWDANGDGTYTIRDALHRKVASIADSEGGFILYVGDRYYELDGVDYVPPPPPAKRAAARWQVRDDAVPSRLLCRVTFAAGGVIGPTVRCPATMRPYGGGRWQADEDGITLRATSGRTKRLNWEDEDHLNGDALHLALVRDRVR